MASKVLRPWWELFGSDPEEKERRKELEKAKPISNVFATLASDGAKDRMLTNSAHLSKRLNEIENLKKNG